MCQIISPERTILLHIPNCFAFPLLLLAGAASLCAVSPISTLLTPEELANILAKARPQLVVTTKVEGEDKLLKALQIVLDRPDGDVGSLSGREVKRWAQELLTSWHDSTFAKQRVWTVDMNSQGGASYYIAKGKRDLIVARDWTSLFGSKEEGSCFYCGVQEQLAYQRVCFSAIETW
jgi:long-subunit acyl-CoA synthetase (AMP-forming)